MSIWKNNRHREKLIGPEDARPGTRRGEEESTLIGVARYIRSMDEPQSADVAIAIIDDYHRRGLGKRLLCALTGIAIQNGIRHFRGHTFWENRPILGMIRKVNAQTVPEGAGVLSFVVDLGEIFESPSVG